MEILETIEQLEVKTNKNYRFNNEGLTISNAQTFKERLLKEYTDLVERIVLLNKFISENINRVDPLLKKQLQIMSEYKEILKLRILQLMLEDIK